MLYHICENTFNLFSEDTGEFGQKAEESKSQPSTQKPGDDYVISSSSSDELEITRVVKRR